MGVPSSEVGYTSATTGRGDHEVHKGRVVALGKNIYIYRENEACNLNPRFVKAALKLVAFC
jgi:hypothetical protein